MMGEKNIYNEVWQLFQGRLMREKTTLGVRSFHDSLDTSSPIQLAFENSILCFDPTYICLIFTCRILYKQVLLYRHLFSFESILKIMI